MESMLIIRLLGVYEVAEMPDVHLIELLIRKPPNEVDATSFTQKVDLLPESSWQAAYDIHYLNEDGTEIIGRFWSDGIPGTETRIAFFMYFVDVSKPLLSQFGEIMLHEPTSMPERLSKIIKFEPVD